MASHSTTPNPTPRNKKTKTHLSDYAECLEPDMMPIIANADDVLESSDLLAVKRKRSRRLTGSSARQGIDVSHYQHTINWEEVASDKNVSYVYIKCSEGSTIKDDRYLINTRGAHQAGIPMGAYHFYRSDSSPEEQLRNMSEIAKKEDFDLVPMIDVEIRGTVAHDRFIADLKKFVKLVSEYYDCKPIFYTGQNFYNKYLAGEFKGYNWMMAKYNGEEPILDDGLNYAFWQYSSKGRVNGIKGNVDRSCLMEGFSLSDVEY